MVGGGGDPTEEPGVEPAVNGDTAGALVVALDADPSSPDVDGREVPVVVVVPSPAATPSAEPSSRTR
jgi:hypothetical protein